MKTPEELEAIRKGTLENIVMRKEVHTATHVLVSMSTICIEHGSRETMLALLDAVAENNLTDITIGQEGIISDDAPVVKVITPDGTTYTYKHVTVEKVQRIVNEHLIGGVPVADYLD